MTILRRGAATALALLPALLSCGKQQDQQLNVLLPDLVAAPETLDFGGVVVPYAAAQEIQLINAGRADLEISAISLIQALDGEGRTVFTVSPASGTVEPDGSLPVLVSFEPPTYLDYDTELVVSSNDPEQPELRIPVLAQGIDGAVPAISVDPLSVDFGLVDQGQTQQAAFVIENTGTGPLEIEASSGLGESAVFHLVSDPAGQVLQPGSSFPVIVEYAPVNGLGDYALYTVQSNDPTLPEVDVLLLGNGGGEIDYPVAVIEAPTDAAPLDTITLDGRGSYDPQGFLPLSYQWTLLDQPAPSTTAISDDTLSTPSLFIDAAGIYTFTLVVDNAIGLSSDPAMHVVAAVPEEDLYVLLSWNTGNSDLDLHLVQADPANYFEVPEDCCYCNPNPNWGEGSDELDDPVLALDNRVGFGPENINIEDPQSGTYYVRVHYFRDNSGGPTEATLSIYVAGELQQTWSRVLTDEQVWDVASITFPEASIVEEDADPYDSPHHECQ